MPLKLPKSRYYRVRIERLERYFKKSMSLRKTESYWLDKNNSKDKNCISILVNKTTKWKWRNERLNQVSAEQKIFKSKTGINLALEVFASCCHKLPHRPTLNFTLREQQIWHSCDIQRQLQIHSMSF